VEILAQTCLGVASRNPANDVVGLGLLEQRRYTDHRLRISKGYSRLSRPRKQNGSPNKHALNFNSPCVPSFLKPVRRVMGAGPAGVSQRLAFYRAMTCSSLETPHVPKSNLAFISFRCLSASGRKSSSNLIPIHWSKISRLIGGTLN